MNHIHRNIIATATLALATLLTACHNDTRSIKHEAEQYIKYTSAYDIDEACKHCTPETAQGLQAIKEYVLPKLDTAYQRLNEQATFDITSVERLTDTSAVVRYCKQTPINQFCDSLHLVCRDNKWMVSVNIVVPSLLRSGTKTFDYDSSIVLTVANSK